MTLADASALIALLSKNDNNHQRCIAILESLSPPLISTFPCFVEAMYLLGRDVGWLGQKALWTYVEENLLLLYQLEARELKRMRVLMEKYQEIPMDLADASLVATAESLNQRLIFTLDRDFFIYRFKDKLAFEVVP